MSETPYNYQPLPDDVTQAPLPEPNANPQRAAQVRSAEDRIADLERQLAQMQAALKAAAPLATNGYDRYGNEVPDNVFAYDNPTKFHHTLVLATGELVGSPTVQSTEHWSRVLQQNVPVVHRLTNAEESEAA